MKTLIISGLFGCLVFGSVLGQVRVYNPGRVVERSVENRANSKVD